MTDPAPLEPLGLDEVKLNLRITSSSEDTLIDDLIVDAREFVERETGLVLVPRAITETAARLGRWIELSSWPVTAVTAIRYPLAGEQVLVAPNAWQASLKRRPVRLIPVRAGWGVGSPTWGAAALPVEIDVQAGYATPADVPRNATRAMHLLCAHWYANRASAEVGARAAAIEVPFGVTVLLDQLRLRTL